jgi:hypothetical protein
MIASAQVGGRRVQPGNVLCRHCAGLTPRSPGSLADGLLLLRIFLYSGPRGIRTLGLLNAIETRSQLRYGPKNVERIVHGIGENVNTRTISI